MQCVGEYMASRVNPTTFDSGESMGDNSNVVLGDLLTERDAIDL